MYSRHIHTCTQEHTYASLIQQCHVILLIWNDASIIMWVLAGRFGSATASYFRFTRWLLFLNFYTFLVSFLVIVVPFIASTTPSAFVKDLNIDDPQPVVNGTKFMNHAINCSATYSRLVKNVTDNEQVHEKVLDFFMGTVSAVWAEVRENNSLVYFKLFSEMMCM